MEKTTQQTYNVQALVIGSGISGLFTALKLAEQNLPTLLITKSALDESNSRYAQGGIAAVLPDNPNDSIELHVQDTLKAGAGLCDEAAVRSILGEGYAAIEDLLHYGVRFDKTQQNTLALTREAAHSVHRILHVGGDATGHSVEMTLIERVKAHPMIQVMEHCQVLELLSDGSQCFGCRAVRLDIGQDIRVLSPNTILATGGIGRLYTHTTNPAIATGDGIALAHQAGAEIVDMAFIQFHPTGFYADGQLHFLISEALRGEGGLLRNARGEPFAKKHHPDGELAPRDIVTRFIFKEMESARLPHVYLDITHLPKSTIESRFPTILANCLRLGVDIRTDQIPVSPAAHYLMGGVSTDLKGQSSLKGLFAVGETARTGLHGANRLASNSLLECVVLARRVASVIQPALLNLPNTLHGSSQANIAKAPHETKAIQRALHHLHCRMWDNVGILRTGEGLKQTLTELEFMAEQAEINAWQHHIPLGWEYCSQLRVARLITKEALQRKESQGAHYRTDCPAEPPKHTMSISA